MKQSIIIYKIYKQDLVVYSTNALPIAHETIASLIEKPLDKLLYYLLKIIQKFRLVKSGG